MIYYMFNRKKGRGGITVDSAEILGLLRFGERINLECKKAESKFAYNSCTSTVTMSLLRCVILSNSATCQYTYYEYEHHVHSGNGCS